MWAGARARLKGEWGTNWRGAWCCLAGVLAHFVVWGAWGRAREKPVGAGGADAGVWGGLAEAEMAAREREIKMGSGLKVKNAYVSSWSGE